MIEDNKKEYRGKYRKDMVFKKERSAEFSLCDACCIELSGSYVSADACL